MVTPELDILVQRYLDNDLTVTETAAFKERLSKNEELKNLVQEYKSIKKAVNTFAVTQIKIDLQQAHSKVSKAKSFNNYKPSLNTGGGFNIFSFLAKIVILSSIATLVLIYVNKMPIHNEYFDKVNEKLHSYDSLFIVKQDTVWTTIRSTGVSKGDTILIRNQAELDKWKKEHKDAKNIKIKKLPVQNINKTQLEEVEDNWD